MTAVNGGAGIFIVRGRRHNDTVQAATKNVAENAQKIKISKPLPWNADDFPMEKNRIYMNFVCLEMILIWKLIPAKKTVANAKEAHIPHFK